MATRCHTRAAALLGLLATVSGATRGGSDGCGLVVPARANIGGSPVKYMLRVNEPSKPLGTTLRTYWLNLPKVYDPKVPSMLVLNFHGFYDTAWDEIYEDSVPTFVNKHKKNVITVYPLGSGDCQVALGCSYSWNVHGNGFNTEPGPEGLVCKVPRGLNDLYVCYNSCVRSKMGCSMRNGCNSASCMDDVGFIKELVEHLVATLCVNLDQIHLTGISAGAIMVYTMALEMSDRIASIAPIAGSNYHGFNRVPAHPVGVLETHGFNDSTVPANASNGMGGGPEGPTGPVPVSNDFFFYTPTPEVTRAYAEANGCGMVNNLAYPTKFDGVQGMGCNRPWGSCRRDVIQCTGVWGHTWPMYTDRPMGYAALVIGFFESTPNARSNSTTIK